MKQKGLFDDLKSEPIHFDTPDANIIYYPDFFNKNQSDEYFETLLKNIDWQQDKMKIYGKEINLPRLTAWYGNKDKNYSFSGITMSPKQWIDELQIIKNLIYEVINHEFNSVLLNLYRNGQDSISWHTDAEKELGTDPTIVSVSFGETRRFQLKHKYKKDLKIIDIDLLHGSLLLMSGTTQHFWLHQIPKTKKNARTRINLTFRNIK